MLHLILMSSNKKINHLKKDYFTISLLAYLNMLKRKNNKYHSLFLHKS